MDRRVRYEVLRNQDDDEDIPAEVQSSPTVVPNPEAALGEIIGDAPPPQYTSQDTTTLTTENETSEGDHKVPEPPSYSVATSLPTYDEAEASKEQDEVDIEQKRQKELVDFDQQRDVELGTDGMFLCTFLISFLFNWIGLLATVCMSHTAAARLGAISGFGLSMVKWAAIVKHNDWASGVASGDSWLWWMLILMGFLIFSRGCLQYIRIKYQWRSLSDYFRQRVHLLF